MPRSSQQESDGVDWSVAALRPGAVGLDLRPELAPNSLRELLNARFADEANLERRGGFTGDRLQDGDAFPASGTNPIAPLGWLYGHGQRLIDPAAATPAFSEDAHYPIAGAARGTFHFGDSDVAWTGDRLLVSRDGDTALGISTYWDEFGAFDSGHQQPAHRGIPAFLPLQTNVDVPENFIATYAETCLTSNLRVVIATAGASITAWVINRETGALIDRSTFGTSPKDIRVLNSGGVPVLLWRQTELFISHWTGAAWSPPSVINDTVTAFDTALTAGGFHLVYRSAVKLFVSEFSGALTTSTHYAPGTAVVTSTSPTGSVAIAVDYASNIFIAFTGEPGGIDQLLAVVLSPSTAPISSGTISSSTGWNSITAAARVLRHESNTAYPFVLYAERASEVHSWEFVAQNLASVAGTDVRYNSKLASHAFVVGNMPFVWARSTNASSHYLIAGAKNFQVSGFADREEGLIRAITDGVQPLQKVSPDPLATAGELFTWISLWNPRSTAIGNLRIGDIDFLPELSTAQYGKSVYLSGSAVRNWDGVTLGDAGFQDYPFVTNMTHTAGGALSSGDYFFRVYAVRYNARGERFQSAAQTSGKLTVSASDHATLTINTIPCTNHADVILEVYRTEAGGTTFYLEGTVANSLTAATVTFNSTMADDVLITKFGDPHATGVGNLVETEEFGPVGCSILAVSGDRMWGAGGQVPAGYAQFSKLKEAGEGAGFDDIGGFQQVDLVGARITSIAAFASGTAVFERNQIYIISGSGPDNDAVGGFGVPELVLADGAISHLGTAAAQVGVFFWGADGPRLLDLSLRVQNISVPVHDLTRDLMPTGIQVDLGRLEATWFTDGGTAMHVNYQNGFRWAQWSCPKIAGCSHNAVVTTDGRLLFNVDDVDDAGVPFAFSGCTHELHAGASLNDSTLLNRIGVVGDFLGAHRLRFRVYFNGSPMWTEEHTWQPANNTWLADGNGLSTLTPAQIDALLPLDKSGVYATQHRASKPNCRSFRVAWSDISAHGPTLLLKELSCEIGTRGGLGRHPVPNFGG